MTINSGRARHQKKRACPAETFGATETLRGFERAVVGTSQWLSWSMFAIGAPGWRGAKKAQTAGMQPRSNEAGRDGSAATAIDVAIRGPLVATKR
jgi:hypothetical protein